MPLIERIRKTGTNGNVTITEEERNNKGRPETEVSPVPAVIVSLPSTDKSKRKPNFAKVEFGHVFGTYYASGISSGHQKFTK